MKPLTAAISLSLLFSGVALAHEPREGSKSPCVVPGAKELRTRIAQQSQSEREIMELERESCRLFAAGELDRAMDLVIAEHGIVLLDGGGIVDGRDEQRRMFKEFFSAGFDLVFEPVDAHVSASDDMAWAIGMYKLTTPDGAVDLGKYVSIWEKVDGEWKNVVEMRNSNH